MTTNKNKVKSHLVTSVAALALVSTMVGVGAPVGQALAANNHPTVSAKSVKHAVVKAKSLKAAQNVKDAAAKYNKLKSEYDQIKVDVDNIEQEQAGLDKVYQEAQKKLNELKPQVEKAKAELKTAQDTLETVKEHADKDGNVDVDKLIADAQAKVDEAQKNLDALKNASTENASKLEAAEKAVASSTEAKEKAEQTIKEAQKKLDEAKAEQERLENTDPNELVSQAKAKLEAAEKALDKVQSDKTANEKALEQIKTDKEKSDKALSDAKAEKAKAEKTLASQEKELKQHQDKLKELQGTNNTSGKGALTGSIKVPSGLNGNTYNDHIDGKTTKAEFQAILQEGMKINKFKDNDVDKGIKVDSLKDARSHSKELNLYALSVINSVREQLGSSELFASVGGMDYANAVADQYGVDDWQLMDKMAHDDKAISDVAGKYGLRTGGNYYENLGSSLYYDVYKDYMSNKLRPSWNTNLNELKRGVYDTIMSMLFDDAGSAFGHFTALTGVKGAFSNQVEKYTNFGFSYDKFGQTHYMIIGPSMITGSKFDKTILTQSTGSNSNSNSDAIKKEQAAISKLNKEIGETRATLTKSDSAIKASEDSLKDLDNKETSLKEKLAKVGEENKKAIDALNQAKDEKSRADNNLNNHDEVVQEAKDNVKKAEKLLSDNETALKDATTALETAQKSLDEIKSTGNSADAITKAEEALKAAQDALKQIESLKGIPNSIAAAQKIVDEKATTLQKIQDAYNDAKKSELDAKSDFNKKTVEVNELTARANKIKAAALNAKAEYDDSVAVLKAYNNLKNLVNNYKGNKESDAYKKAVEIVQNGNGTIDEINNAIKSLNSVKAGNKTVNGVNHGKNNVTGQKTLPNSGEEVSMVATAVGGFLSSLGLAGVFRKRH